MPQTVDDNLAIDLGVLTAEPADEYHAQARENLSSHQLIDFMKCPWLYRKKQLGLLPNDDKAWYLLADPNRLPALEVAFLNGVDRPTVEKTDADFNTLGVMFRGYIDFGVREQDHRGALMMKGEA